MAESVWKFSQLFGEKNTSDVEVSDGAPLSRPRDHTRAMQPLLLQPNNNHTRHTHTHAIANESARRIERVLSDL